MKAIRAKSEQNVTETHGSPLFDVLAKTRGAWPFIARLSKCTKSVSADFMTYGRCTSLWELTKGSRRGVQIARSGRPGYVAIASELEIPVTV